MIEVASFQDGLWDRVKHALEGSVEIPTAQDDKDPFLHLWVESSPALLMAMEKQSVPLSITTDGIHEEMIETQNVVGFLEGTDPDLKEQYLMYSAHYDHVGIGEPDATGDSIYNGARDNAIGTTAVLSMAENLGKYPTKRSAFFIFFTAEEKGLLGSRYYVENPLFPLKNIVYGFNTDGGGYNNTDLATIIGLGRTTAAKHMIEGAKTFGLKAIDDPAPEQGLFDRSDNVSFAKAGVPAPTYSTGFDAFDDEIFKYYHQASDEADSLDYDYLLKFFRGYVLSGRLIANDPETPFWVKDDKYEAAGNELYQRNKTVKQ
ncbi:M28 family peptidase [Croceiramulus getboli]|nr:M28 family peptidase [Flavobacteriaceae bacterium YJPT1-3]